MTTIKFSTTPHGSARGHQMRGNSSEEVKGVGLGHTSLSFTFILGLLQSLYISYYFHFPHDFTSPNYHLSKVTVLAEKGELGKSPFFLAHNPSKLQLLINGCEFTSGSLIRDSFDYISPHLTVA